ncbi:hypothetical protein [Dongshaea marina]|uniref:hypothetical protein n=1 Tax=Dongshaea marina TaxID=2047966 RepID=UPI000D3EA7B0|nr:hypothetical protein [Dongshaea marina]
MFRLKLLIACGGLFICLAAFAMPGRMGGAPQRGQPTHTPQVVKPGVTPHCIEAECGDIQGVSPVQQREQRVVKPVPRPPLVRGRG